MSKTAIAYVAAKRGESVLSRTVRGQLSLIEAYARSNGFELAAFFQDEIDRPVPLAIREGGSEMVRALKDESHSVTTILVLDETVFDSTDDFFACRRGLSARGVSIHVIDPKPATMSLKRKLSDMVKGGARVENVSLKRG